MKEGVAAGIPGGQGFELLLCLMFLKERLCRGDWIGKKRIGGGGVQSQKSRACAANRTTNAHARQEEDKVDGTSKRNSSSSSMAVQCCVSLAVFFYYYYLFIYFCIFSVWERKMIQEIEGKSAFIVGAVESRAPTVLAWWWWWGGPNTHATGK